MSGVFVATESPLHDRMLVEASAGTGKTYAITTLFVRLLLEHALDVDQVLVVTFTEAATAELRDRVRGRLRATLAALHSGGESGDAELDAMVRRREDPVADRRRIALALRNVDQAAIFTIHGFCHRVLHDNAFDSGASFEQELVTDLGSLRDEVIADWWVKELADGMPERIAWLHALEITPSSSRGFVDRVVGNRDLALVPEPAEIAEDGWRDRFRQALAEARGLWDEAEVLARLAAVRMHRQKYKPEHLPEWCRNMTAFLADPNPAAWKKPLTKFCTTALQDGRLKKGSLPEHPFFDACERLGALCEQFASVARAYGIAFRHRLAGWARSEMPPRKEHLGVLSFDDLLQKLDDALAVRGSDGPLARTIRKRWPVALVDEFQDTDPLQWRIFDTVYREPKTRLVLVGDPKQAIYSFRGADVFAYLAARDRTPPEGHYTLGRNWRSGPGLVQAVQDLFARSMRPFFVADIGLPRVEARAGAEDRFRAGPPFGQAPLEVLFVRRDDEELEQRKPRIDTAWRDRRLARVVAAEIAALLRSGAKIGADPIGPGQLAVLTRTNKEAFDVQTALRELDVPGVVIGDRSVFEQDEAEDLLCVLRAVAEPGDRRAVRAALTTVLLGVDANELAEMDAEPGQWDHRIEQFRRWSTLWDSRGFVQMVRVLLAEAEVQPRLLGLSGGERRMTNLLHLTELLHEAASTRHLGATALLHWFAMQRHATGPAPEQAQIRLESDERAVKITTVHKAKGLEYDVVYCPYLWSGWLLHPEEDKGALLFHDVDGVSKLDIDPKREKDGETVRQVEREKLSESLRLLYVALTRARHRCTVVWGAFRTFETAALGTLLHPLPVAADDVEAVREHLSRRSDDEMMGDLTALAATVDGRISVRELDRDARGRRSESESTAFGDAVCRQPKHRVDFGWRVASFSGLASSAPARGIDADEARERDELASESEPVAAPPAAGPTIRLATFPRGARAGVLFHEILEHSDFAASSAVRRELIASMLRRHGFDAAWLDTVDDALATALATPLTEEGMRLMDVARDRRLDELEFHLPVAARGLRLTPKRLAAVFRDHPSAALPTDYADRIGRLEFMQLQGFLKGYVDCVFEHGGRFWVVDYKTSHLGERLDHYARPRLSLPMSHGHYFLQYHLYALAVDRYLRQRLPDYRYERDFGGVLYLFLRGMDPSAGSGCGVFFEKPPAGRLHALGTVLDG